jgi:nitrate/nitrite transporter NarK
MSCCCWPARGGKVGSTSSRQYSSQYAAAGAEMFLSSVLIHESSATACVLPAPRGWCQPRSSSNSCSSLAGWQAALLNPRLYLLAGTYAACFGMELVVANIVSLYLFNQFGLSLTVAGLLGECARVA